MAPYFETEFNPRKRTQKIIRELKEYDTVTLVKTKGTQVKVSIGGSGEAVVWFSQDRLIVSAGDLKEDGVIISFTEDVLPQGGLQRVKEKSICTYGRDGSGKRVIWKP